METLSNLPVSFDPLSVKRSFNLAAPPELIIPDNFGTLHIEMKEAELLEFDLGKGTGYRGYLIIGDELSPLPIGSTLDPLTGRFSWLPGPGFIAVYDLLFIENYDYQIQKIIIINLRIHPKSSRQIRDS